MNCIMFCTRTYAVVIDFSNTAKKEKKKKRGGDEKRAFEHSKNNKTNHMKCVVAKHFAVLSKLNGIC